MVNHLEDIIEMKILELEDEVFFMRSEIDTLWEESKRYNQNGATYLEDAAEAREAELLDKIRDTEDRIEKLNKRLELLDSFGHRVQFIHIG